MKGKGDNTPKPPWEHLFATSEVNSWHRERLDWKTELIKYLGCSKTADKSTQGLNRDFQLVAVSVNSGSVFLIPSPLF